MHLKVMRCDGTGSLELHFSIKTAVRDALPHTQDVQLAEDNNEVASMSGT